MMTFSIYQGTNFESDLINIIGLTCVDLSGVLNPLHDNDNKEIYPKKIRNAILTSCSTSGFKETSAINSNLTYIGIDILNDNYLINDSKYKLYFGKRMYKDNDIMSFDLLNNDSDIFLYNTKLDNVSNNKTKISILSGTNSNLYRYSPYIQSQSIITSTNSSSFDIINQSNLIGINSGISINSNNGNVSINNIIFPKISESLGNYSGITGCSNNRVMKWNNNQIIWDDIVFTEPEYIGSTESQLDIYGSVVNVNGYPLDLTDERECTCEIGDINIGTKFNSYPISDILRRIIYPYSPPSCEIRLIGPYSNGYVEVGDIPNIELEYTIHKKTNPTSVASLYNMIPSSYPSILTSVYTSINGISNGVIISPVRNSGTTFSISVSDGIETSSSSVSVHGIYPYFYGFSNLSNISTYGLSELYKIIEPCDDKFLDITGYGNLYFIYDYNYPSLNDIYDDQGNSIFASFSYQTMILSSPTGLWSSKKFRVYQYNDIDQIGPPSVIYHFKY